MVRWFLPINESPAVLYERNVAGLLILASVVALVTSLVCCYRALLEARLRDGYSGHGLVQCALAILYLTLLVFAIDLGSVLWPMQYAAYGVLGLIAVHALAFAFDSPFGTQATPACVLAGSFLSLLSCSVLWSRESARRTECQRTLQLIMMNVEGDSLTNSNAFATNVGFVGRPLPYGPAWTSAA
jgi:hypothetical protein